MMTMMKMLAQWAPHVDEAAAAASTGCAAAVAGASAVCDEDLG